MDLVAAVEGGCVDVEVGCEKIAFLTKVVFQQERRTSY